MSIPAVDLDEDTSARLLPFFRVLAWTCIGMMAAAVAGVQVFGWWLDWEPARSILPGAEEMKTEATLAFAAAALAFWLLRPGSRHVLFRVVGFACAAIVILVGCQDVFDYVTHGLFESHALTDFEELATADADMRSPETGLVLIVSGIALAGRSVQWRQWSLQKTLSLVPITVGLFTLVSFAFPSSETYWTGQYTAMAFGTDSVISEDCFPTCWYAEA